MMMTTIFLIYIYIIYNIVFREQMGYSHHTNILNISKEHDANLPFKWDMIRPELR